jgi:hypothetical protein
MSYWMENLNEVQHYYTLRREAEQHRLARQGLKRGLKNHQAWCKALSWFGSRLSVWGKQLQERYGIVSAAYPSVRNQVDGEKIIKGI